MAESKDIDFGAELLSEAASIHDAVEQRGLSRRQRQERLLRGIDRLMCTYLAEAIYLNGTDVQVPVEGGVGVGLSETVGEIKGFSYGSYLTTRGQQRSGMLMLMGVAGMNDKQADQSPWRQNVLKQYGTEIPEVEGSEQFIIGVPLQPGQRITKLHKSEPLPNTLDELDQAASETKQDYDYMDYVRRIDAITGGFGITTSAHDQAKARAAFNENAAMNDSCPYLGQEVEITTSLARVRNPDNPDRMLLLAGTVSGVLRKFINDSYQVDGEWRYGTQAVLWEPGIASEVYRGELTAQQADLVAIFVPLSLPHELRVKT